MKLHLKGICNRPSQQQLLFNTKLFIMNKLSLWRLLLAPFVLGMSFSSCKKELEFKEDNNESTSANEQKRAVTRPYRDHFDAWFRMEPGIDENTLYIPGGGEGNVAHMGKASSYFNQLATLVNGFPASSIPADVTMFFGDELSAFQVPAGVNSIVFDKKGNSIWFKATAPSTTTPVSPTRINFTGPVAIVGGTGKFAGATGQVILTGYFNPADLSDAGFEQEGWIRY
jgi:hypothetical protein